MLDFFLYQQFNQLGRQLCIGACQQLTGFLVHDIVSQDLAFEVFSGNDQLVDPGFLHVTDMLCRDAAAFLDNQLATELDVENSRITAQTLGYEAHANFFRREVKIVFVEEDVEHLFVVQSECTQNDRHRQLPATVDTGENRVLWIELEIEPGTAVRNDSC